jgi:hypothetical protein
MSNKKTFNKGDIVISTNSSAHRPAKYLGSYSSWGGYYCEYLHNNRTTYLTDIKLYQGDNQMTQPNQSILYSFTNDQGEVTYGTYLATNQANQMVIEEKGTGKLYALPKEALEEVVPYTYRTHRDVHFQGDKGSVEVGDFLMDNNGNTHRVLSLDTKARNVNRFKGVKLLVKEM